MYSVFMKHYGYTSSQALNEYAKTFFALCAQMYKQQAMSDLQQIAVISASVGGGKDADNLISRLRKQAEGNDQMIEEAQTLRRVRNGN